MILAQKISRQHIPKETNTFNPGTNRSKCSPVWSWTHDLYTCPHLSFFPVTPVSNVTKETKQNQCPVFIPTRSHICFSYSLQKVMYRVCDLSTVHSTIYLPWYISWGEFSTSAADFTRYPLLLGVQRHHGMRSFPNTSTHEVTLLPFQSCHQQPCHHESIMFDFSLATIFPLPPSVKHD